MVSSEKVDGKGPQPGKLTTEEYTGESEQL